MLIWLWCIDLNTRIKICKENSWIFLGFVLCFFKIVRIGNFRPETNPKQAKISCLRVVLFVSIKNLHLLTKLRHFRVSFKIVFLSTYNVPIPHPILAVFRLRLSKFFHQRTMHRLNCTTKPRAPTQKRQDSRHNKIRTAICGPNHLYHFIISALSLRLRPW